MAGAGAHHAGAAAQRIQLAGEITGYQRIEQLIAALSRDQQLDVALDDDEEAARPIAGIEQDLTGVRRPALTVMLKARDLRGRELGEHLAATRAQQLIVGDRFRRHFNSITSSSM